MYCDISFQSLLSQFLTLPYIALKGNLNIAALLVEAGALLDRTTREGRTALYLAVQEGKTK